MLEILTDKKHRDIIQRLESDSDFKLFKPGKVADLWDKRKENLKMNCDKMPRALRHYYDKKESGGIISRVSPMHINLIVT